MLGSRQNSQERPPAPIRLVGLQEHGRPIIIFYFFAIVIIDPSIKFSLPTALCCNNSWVIVAHSDRMNAGLYESPSLASGSPSNAKHTTYHL